MFTSRKTRQSTIKESSRWHEALLPYGIPQEIIFSMENTSDKLIATARFKKAVSTIQWISGKDLASIESDLLQHCIVKDAAGSIRSIASRTRDIIPATVQVAKIKLHNQKIDLSNTLDELLIKLELGISTSMVGIAKILGNQITRSDYMSLKNSDIVTLEKLSELDERKLSSILGSKEKMNTVNRLLSQKRNLMFPKGNGSPKIVEL